MCANYLNMKEWNYCDSLLKSLNNIPWIKPLIRRVEESGGITKKNKPLLFELRFAADLHHIGLSADYEYKTSINDYSVDFRIIKDNFSWLVELKSIQTSDAVKHATKYEGPYEETILVTGAGKQSGEEEIVRVQRKILEKVFEKEKHIKFPTVSDNVFSLILIDMRGYLGAGEMLANAYDYREITYGIAGLERNNRWMAHYQKDRNGKKVPTIGLFGENNPLIKVSTLQERIHFLGFVAEKEFGPGKLLKQIYYLANPLLFNTNDSKMEAYNKMPFRKEILNSV